MPNFELYSPKAEIVKENIIESILNGEYKEKKEEFDTK